MTKPVAHLCVDFIDDPFESLTATIRVEADVVREDVLHVSVERHSLYAHCRLLF